ncbi:MAG: hypothetical protein ACFCVF_12835 [Kineosporiaceae bacterium]
MDLRLTLDQADDRREGAGRTSALVLAPARRVPIRPTPTDPRQIDDHKVEIIDLSTINSPRAACHWRIVDLSTITSTRSSISRRSALVGHNVVHGPGDGLERAFQTRAMTPDWSLSPDPPSEFCVIVSGRS